jgi:hypothetical protein
MLFSVWEKDTQTEALFYVWGKLTVLGAVKLDVELRHVVLDHLHLVVAHHAVDGDRKVSRNNMTRKKTKQHPELKLTAS